MIGLVALVALAFSFVLFREVLAADQGTPNMIRDRRGGPGRRAGLPQAAVPDAVRRGGRGLRAAVRAARRRCRPAGRPIHLLPGRRRLLGHHRLLRHVAGHPGQPAGRGGRQQRGPRAGHPDRVPHRWRGRHGHRRPRPARRVHRGAGLHRPRAQGAGGLRLRRGHPGDVHACRRRHLHQGRRRRRRPGRQGRGGHPRGRPAQRRHHRRQRR